MLILTRKKGQSIVIDGNTEIFISAVEGDQVKIGIVAPAHVKIYRKELLDEIRASNKAAVVNRDDLAQLQNFSLDEQS